MSRRQTPGGYPTAKGYRRGYRGGRQRLIHNWVWEQHHGPIPEGFQVHHRNGDREDNRIENLALVTPTEHKRIHSPHFRRGDGWERCCSICGEWKPADAEHFYLNKQGWVLYGRCRPCHIARVVADKQRRKQRMS